jgi:hypothetical protein
LTLTESILSSFSVSVINEKRGLVYRVFDSKVELTRLNEKDPFKMKEEEP